MTLRITAAELNTILDVADLPSSAATATYSGRFMYGEECVGFDIDNISQMSDLTLALAEVYGTDKARAIMDKARTDSMGLGMIVYFPGVEAEGWTDDSDDFSDEEDEDDE